MIPVRCFTCGKVIGDKWEDFKKKIKEGEKVGKILDELKIERYCCRRTFISHIEVLEELLKYTQVRDDKESDSF